MSNVRKIARSARKFMPVLAAIGLGACAQGWKGEVDDVYQPVSYTERYPIDVVKGTVKVNVPTRSARLSAAQRDAVTRYAQQAYSSGARKITIRRPANNVNADVIAGRITQIFAEQGVNGNLLQHRTYVGRKGAPVSLAFVRKFARTKQCGNWTKDFSENGDNRAYEDFGCSQQFNLAAQVANPQDFVTPRTSTPSDPMRRQRVIADYRTPKSTSTPVDGNAEVSTTGVGKAQ